jgi:glycosyltransferase involved in cell wall biosynthesis
MLRRIMPNPANILFIHQNFPGQYRFLAPALAARGHTVRALAINANPAPAGVAIDRYAPRRATTAEAHPWAQDFETKVLRGEACAAAIERQGRDGFVPDLVCANPGWGESLFVKDVLPKVPLDLYLEYFYPVDGGDAGFDPEFAAPGPAGRARVRAKRAAPLLALDAMDSAICPTRWQRDTFPAAVRSRIEVCFDGVDTQAVRPDPQAVLEADGRSFRAGEPIVTFVNRNLEPYRGYHVFMRALPALFEAVPEARVLVVGGDGVSYGARPADGITYRQRFFDEVKGSFDASRVHFLGQIPYATFLRVLQVSAAHAYLTYPFVLSWSMVEAMAAGCLVVGSRTGPVEEMVRDGENGRLVDFFDTAGLARTLADALRRPAEHAALRARARADTVANYDLGACLDRQVARVEAMLG